MSKKRTIPCDKKGRPIIPSDTDWRVAIMRAAIFIAAGAILLPAGICLFNFVPLGPDMGAIKFFFGMLMFFGALFLLFGGAIAVLALVQRHNSPDEETVARNAIGSGEYCSATVVKASMKEKKGVAYYRARLEYDDALYGFKRRFDSGWECEKAVSVGDTVGVYYLPDSNIGYFVDITGEKRLYDR